MYTQDLTCNIVSFTDAHRFCAAGEAWVAAHPCTLRPGSTSCPSSHSSWQLVHPPTSKMKRVDG